MKGVYSLVVLPAAAAAVVGLLAGKGCEEERTEEKGETEVLTWSGEAEEEVTTEAGSAVLAGLEAGVMAEERLLPPAAAAAAAVAGVELLAVQLDAKGTAAAAVALEAAVAEAATTEAADFPLREAKADPAFGI